MSKDYNRYYLQIKRDFKPNLIRKRKEFMELLLKALSDDEEAEKALRMKFGTSMIAKTSDGSDMTVHVDGERIFKL